MVPLAVKRAMQRDGSGCYTDSLVSQRHNSIATVLFDGFRASKPDWVLQDTVVDPMRFMATLATEGVTHLVAVPALLRASVAAMTTTVGAHQGYLMDRLNDYGQTYGSTSSILGLK